MRDGFRIVDIDTHVNSSYETLVKHLDPGARKRVDELMHQSDYPHGEAHFPDTAQIVLDWPIWQDLGREIVQKHMAGNAEKFLRLS